MFRQIFGYNYSTQFLGRYYAGLSAIILVIVLFTAAFSWMDLAVIQQSTAGLAPAVSAESTSPQGWKLESTPEVQGLVSTAEKEQFRLRIPASGVDKSVIANVDPARESVYGPIINHYVAHGKYTKLPDEGSIEGNVYLFAHREGQHNGRDIGFFRHLDKLSKGDRAYIDYAGRTYIYEAYESFIIEPTDVWVYTPKSEFPSLTLQTCENGEEQRLIVRLKLIRVQ